MFPVCTIIGEDSFVITITSRQFLYWFLLSMWFPASCTWSFSWEHHAVFQLKRRLVLSCLQLNWLDKLQDHYFTSQVVCSLVNGRSNIWRQCPMRLRQCTVVVKLMYREGWPRQHRTFGPWSPQEGDKVRKSDGLSVFLLIFSLIQKKNVPPNNTHLWLLGRQGDLSSLSWQRSLLIKEYTRKLACPSEQIDLRMFWWVNL